MYFYLNRMVDDWNIIRVNTVITNNKEEENKDDDKGSLRNGTP